MSHAFSELNTYALPYQGIMEASNSSLTIYTSSLIHEMMLRARELDLENEDVSGDPYESIESGGGALLSFYRNASLHGDSAPATAASVMSASALPATNGGKVATANRLDLVRILNDLSHARHQADLTETGAQHGRESIEQSQGETFEEMEARRDALKRTLVESHDAFIASAAQLEAARSVTKSITNWITAYQETILPYIILDDDNTNAGGNVINAIRAMTKIHTDRVDSLHAEHTCTVGALSSAVRAAHTTMEVSASMQCCLCLDRMCNRAFVPCGHMICSTCYEKSPRVKACFTCRSRVTDVLRLFMN